MNLQTRLRQWIQRIFIGRNGIDQLAVTVLIIAGICALLASITKHVAFAFVYLVLFVYVVWRSISTNIGKRRQENQAFLSLGGRIPAALRLRLRMIKELPTHRYLKCPQCRSHLRLPRGKGRVAVRCTKCGHSFIRKV